MPHDDSSERVHALEAENARLRRLLEQGGLPAALRHQVRNVLSLMRSILRRSSETSASVEEYAAHLEGRFDALLRVQSMVVAAGDKGVDLHALVGDELLAHVIHEGDKATLTGPPVSLRQKVAELLGLAIHELVTNAVKFGAMTVPDGRIAMDWQVSLQGEQRMLAFTWVESGLTDLLPEPAQRGFGMTTLEDMLRYQLNAESTVAFLPTGLRCVMTLPLDPEKGR